jgi:hypothetical protein
MGVNVGVKLKKEKSRVPIPKFAIPRGLHLRELRNQKDTSTLYNSHVVLDLTLKCEPIATMELQIHHTGLD